MSLMRRQSTSDLTVPKSQFTRSLSALDRSPSRYKFRHRLSGSQRGLSQYEAMQSRLAAVTAAFSAAGQERRNAFQQRRWNTIAGLEAGTANRQVPGEVEFDTSSHLESISPETPVQNERYLSTPRSYSRKEKSVSFEDEQSPAASSPFLSSARFEGYLNVDLNEITMNLVPFPRLHYLVSSQTPLYALKDIKNPRNRLDQMFSDAFSRDHQMIRADPKHSLYLSCALMVRGNIEASDIRRNIDRLRPSLNFISWNQEGWKTGLCSVPPVNHPFSLLSLANNTCVKNNFSDLRDRFHKLYKRKAHIHHYTHVEGMENIQFDESLESLNSIIKEYSELEKQMAIPPEPVQRLQIAT